MKIKKRSTAAIICAAMLVAGVSAVFATSPKPVETKNIEGLPPAVMTPSTPTPTPTPSEKDVPETTPERLHPITSTAPNTESTPSAPDMSTAPQLTPSAPDMSTAPRLTPAAPERVHPITAADPEPDTEPVQPEPVAPVLENRWGVPDGEIPMLAEFVVEDQEDGAELGKYLEATHGLYPEDYTFGRSGSTGIAFVQVHYYETKARNERLIDGKYPVNSKGETYGSGLDSRIVGYDPDLIAVKATNGTSGYAVDHELSWGGYPGQVNTPDDALAYMEWLKTQPNPRLVPVYDAEHENIVGYFEIYESADYGITPDMSLEEARELVRQGPPQ